MGQVLDAERPRVSVVIPALNEARNIGHTLGTLPEDTFEVILVDGGSTDGTVEVARLLYPGIRVVRQTGVGKGDALAAGVQACRGDAIVLIDADGSTDGGEIPRFVDALMQGADVAKGSRFMPGGGSRDISPLRRAGNAVFCALVNLLFGTRYSDLCYGFNAGWKTSFDRIALDCAGFEVETVLGIRAAVSGLRVTEVPSLELPRLHGSSNLRPMRDGWRVLRAILRERLSAPAVPAIAFNPWPMRRGMRRLPSALWHRRPPGRAGTRSRTGRPTWLTRRSPARRSAGAAGYPSMSAPRAVSEVSPEPR